MDWTAAGTFVLAAFTGGLAWQTRGMVKAAKHELSVERIALELQLEPRLVPAAEPRRGSPHRIGGDQSREIALPVIIPFENAGSGVAQVERPQISIDSWASPSRVLVTPVIPGGHAGEIRADFTMLPGGTESSYTAPTATAFDSGVVIHVQLDYRGAGERRYVVQFSWMLERGGVWRSTLDNEQGHLELPLATSG